MPPIRNWEVIKDTKKLKRWRKKLRRQKVFVRLQKNTDAELRFANRPWFVYAEHTAVPWFLIGRFNTKQDGHKAAVKYMRKRQFG